MSQAFYRKWRPQTWDEVVSQDHVIQTLRNAVRTGRTGHAYLLAGPRGTGKTTTARLLAKALNCLADDPANRPCDECAHCQALNAGRFLDLIEIDAASNTSVEDVRDLRDKINFSPTQGRCKVYIIDEVHMLSTAAFNALLKTLEEPPAHAIFILATTEVHKIPATILSRVQRYEFRRIPVEKIVQYLKQMAAEEGLQVDDEALTLIARQATGAMRDAISLLDQLSSTGERVTLAEAQVVLGTATSSMVIELVEAIQAKDAAAGLKIVQAALDAGTDARQFARQIVDYLRNLLLVRMGNANQVDATREMRARMTEQARIFEPHALLETIRLFNNAATDARSSWHPGLALELAFAEAVEDKGQYVQVSAPAVAAVPAATTAAAQPSPTPRREAAEPPAPRASDSSARMEPPTGKAEPSRSSAAEAPSRNEPAAQIRSQPAAPAQSQAQPAASGAREITQTDVQQNWARIRQTVKKKSPLAEGLLNSCRHSVKDNALILAFSSEVVKSKMEIPENLQILRDTLQTVLGAPMNVRCVLSGSKSAQPDGIDGDGMVSTALDLGGQIVIDD